MAMDTRTTGVADTAMTVALDLTMVAAAMEVVPAIWVRLLFSWSQGNVAAINGAAGDWAAAATKVSDAATVLDRAASGVSPQDWTAADRAGYDKAVARACRQLGDVHDMLDTAGRALEVVAEALAAYDFFAVGVAAILVEIGVAIVASESTVVGSVDVPGLEAAAATVFGVVAAATVVLAAVGAMAGGVLQTAAVLAARAGARDGDAHAYRDLAHGEEVGAAAAYANLAQDAINAGLDYAARGNGVEGARKTLGVARKGRKYEGSDAGPVDLDADRSWNRTWNVGGGAQYGPASVSGHVQVGDDGFEGYDTSASVGTNEDWQVGGSHSLHRGSDGDWHEKATLSAGYEGTAGSAGVAVTGRRDTDQAGDTSYGAGASAHARDAYGIGNASRGASAGDDGDD
jgi:hypothetical protein